MRSAIYDATLWHRRHGEPGHAFRTRMALPWLDLDELHDVAAAHPLWSLERRNAVSFRRRDYLGDPGVPLRQSVLDLVEARTGRRPAGPVSMLGHVRTWGWLFNPLTVYACGDPVEALVLEVTNTPWHERHTYVLDGGAGEHHFPKEMHVSPFLPMDLTYRLRLRDPGDLLALQLATLDGDRPVFEAALTGRRLPIDRHTLGRVLRQRPLGTHRVSAGIYRQAASLWRKGATFHPHPRGRRMRRTIGGAEVVVHDRRALLALLRGSKGLGSSYVEGWWDSDDLTGVLRALLRATDGAVHVLDRAGAALAPLRDPVARLTRREDPERDRRDIHAHYDIGNDFYALMLDPTMTYSCAVFEPAGIGLRQAQEAKLDRLCQRLELSPHNHVVEIGTGWGGFAEHAAGRYGCRVTTTTISGEQYDHARKRIAEAGLADRVTVLDLDYRHLEGRFDKLVSVEMVEAVDWREHGTYFGACARLLRPGGRAALQAIVIDDRSYERAKHHDDFIRTAIFPGGCLPSIGSLAVASSRAGFRLVELASIGHHYPATLRAWRDNLHARAEEVAALGLDERFRRLWDFYLAYCEAGFLERRVGTVQAVFERTA